MNILVTGGTGFLGRHLVPYLREKSAQVTVVNSSNCNLTEKQNLLQFKEQKFDQIYHLACWTQAGDFCLYHPGDQWIINQQINTNILWFWKTFQPQATMVAMGTSCAYPYGEKPLAEENYMRGEPDPCLYTYAMTKRMLYTGLLALQKQFGLCFQYLIPSTLYGPLFEPHDCHFILDLIKKIHAGKTKGERVVLWGTGEQIRELIFVDDAIQLIDQVAEAAPNQLLNLGSGQGYTIAQYAGMICNMLDYDPSNIQYDTTKYSGNPKRVFDTSNIKKLFPEFSFTDLQIGLEKTITYYQSTL